MSTLRERFAHLQGLRWVPMKALHQEHHVACIDGRHSDCVIGAPGGDTGEFLLLLAALESVSNVEFSSQSVEEMLRRFVSEFGRFYQHTDTQALQRLTKALDIDADTPEQLLAAIQQGPDDAQREAWHAQIHRPEHVGCGHLRLAIEHPEAYALRPELIQHTFRAFFELLWQPESPVDYIVLQGEHNEEALVTLRVDAEINGETLMPSVCDLPDAPNVFIHHVSAREYLLRAGGRFLMGLADLDRVASDLGDAVDNMVEAQLQETSQRLLGDLERFDIVLEPPSVVVS